MASESDGVRHRRPGWIEATDGLIRLDQVDFTDLTYRITTQSDINELTRSIEHMGVLVPPLLKPDGPRLVIVSGFLRLQACRQLDLSRITARLLAPNCTDLDCCRCAIAENGFQRPLNSLEEARAIALLASVVQEEGRIISEAAALGLPANPAMVSKLLELSKLPAVLQDRLLDGTVGIAMALELGQQESEFGSKCADLFGDMRIGLNRQREILGLITEIAAREELSPVEVFKRDAFQKIVAHPDLERPQKIGKIHRWLYCWRFPNLARTEEDFETHRSRLKLGRHLQLTAPKFFESDTYTVRLKFKDIKEFQDGLERLERIRSDPNLKRILSRGDVKPS